MKKDLPIYDIKLSDDTQGVGFISLVDEPAIGVDWIKLAKQEPIELFMSLTGDGLCFGCPPNGDGTRVNGEPDARCKGDGSGKGGSGKGGSKGVGSKSNGMDPVAIEKFGGPMDRKMEYEDTYLDNKQKLVGALPRKEREEYSKSSRDLIKKYNPNEKGPRTVMDNKTWDRMSRDEKIKWNKETGIMNESVNRENYGSAVERAITEREKAASEKRINNNPSGKGLKNNNEYNSWREKNGIVARDDTGKNKGWISNDETWDYKTGKEVGRPSASSKRVVNHDRRSSDDVREGYPSHKTWITWGK